MFARLYIRLDSRESKNEVDVIVAYLDRYHCLEETAVLLRALNPLYASLATGDEGNADFWQFWRGKTGFSS